MKKRRKKSEKQKLKDKAWKVFSAYIRKRDRYCVTCLTEKGIQVPTQNAGHFHHNVLDHDEENVNGQCVHCNKWKSGNLAPYSVYLLRKLGKKKFEELNIRHFKDMVAYHDEEYYLNIIKKYE